MRSIFPKLGPVAQLVRALDLNGKNLNIYNIYMVLSYWVAIMSFSIFRQAL